MLLKVLGEGVGLAPELWPGKGGAAIMTVPPKLNPGEEGETLKETGAVRRRNGHWTGKNNSKADCGPSSLLSFSGLPWLLFLECFG